MRSLSGLLHPLFLALLLHRDVSVVTAPRVADALHETFDVVRFYTSVAPASHPLRAVSLHIEERLDLRLLSLSLALSPLNVESLELLPSLSPRFSRIHSNRLGSLYLTQHSHSLLETSRLIFRSVFAALARSLSPRSIETSRFSSSLSSASHRERPSVLFASLSLSQSAMTSRLTLLFTRSLLSRSLHRFHRDVSVTLSRSHTLALSSPSSVTRRSRLYSPSLSLAVIETLSLALSFALPSLCESRSISRTSRFTLSSLLLRSTIRERLGYLPIALLSLFSFAPSRRLGYSPSLALRLAPSSVSVTLLALLALSRSIETSRLLLASALPRFSRSIETFCYSPLVSLALPRSLSLHPRRLGYSPSLSLAPRLLHARRRSVTLPPLSLALPRSIETSRLLSLAALSLSISAPVETSIRDVLRVYYSSLSLASASASISSRALNDSATFSSTAMTFSQPSVSLTSPYETSRYISFSVLLGFLYRSIEDVSVTLSRSLSLSLAPSRVSIYSLCSLLPRSLLAIHARRLGLLSFLSSSLSLLALPSLSPQLHRDVRYSRLALSRSRSRRRRLLSRVALTSDR
ncbi:hypothetical protein C7M84_016554 [Penaeus vannamei]|uniref:Uncharacterized protein n=1 Tax=Penaeus vannamei TaxID=6689 RepID=A0A423SMI8_PENVA|nr:hypothetical protein C7M84_016554 [Penaeus vannamei]